MDSTHACTLCNQDILVASYISHLFQCICKFCDQNKIPRLCTCLECNGVTVHAQNTTKNFRRVSIGAPESSFPFNNYTQSLKLNSYCQNISTPTINPNNNNPNINGNSNSNSNNNNNSIFSADQPVLNMLAKSIGDTVAIIRSTLAGKICCICGTKKGGSIRIPTVRVGPYHKLIVCKTEDLTCDHAIRLIKYIELAMNKNCRLYSHILTNGSDEEDNVDNNKEKDREKASHNREEGEVTCDGYINLEKPGPQRCATLTSQGGIWIEEDRTIKTFCKATHLLRYLIKSWAFGKNRSKKRKKDEEDVDDVKEEEEEEDDQEDNQPTKTRKKAAATKAATRASTKSTKKVNI